MYLVPGFLFTRDKSAKLGVLGLIDHTHPTAAQFLDDAVVRDGLSHKLERSRHWRECYDAIRVGSMKVSGRSIAVLRTLLWRLSGTEKVMFPRIRTIAIPTNSRE
jgi:hypothetical protein